MDRLIRMKKDPKTGAWVPDEFRGVGIINDVMSLLFTKYRYADEFWPTSAIALFEDRLKPPTAKHVGAIGTSRVQRIKGLSEYLAKLRGRFELEGSQSNYTKLHYSSLNGVRRFHFDPLQIDRARDYKLRVEREEARLAAEEMRRNLDINPIGGRRRG